MPIWQAISWTLSVLGDQAQRFALALAEDQSRSSLACRT